MDLPRFVSPRPLLALAALVLLALPARADFALDDGSGHAKPTGGVAAGGGGGYHGVNDYSLDPDGWYGGNAGGPSATCSGQVHYSWAWQGPGAPPSQVVLEVEGRASWGGAPGGSASAGIPGAVYTPSSPYPGGPVTSGSSQGTAYLVKDASGGSVAYDVEPHASDNGGSVGAAVRVTLAPVVLSVDGTKPLGDGLETLIGIHQIGKLTCSGYTLKSFAWTVSGPQIFGSVTMASDQSSRHYDTSLVYPDANVTGNVVDEGDEVSFYASRRGSETVSCTAEVYAPTGADLGSVSASKDANVLAPTSTLNAVATTASRSTFLPDSVNPTDLSSDDGTDEINALEFDFKVDPEPDFSEYSPKVNLCQLAGEDDTFTPDGRFGWVGWWLDTKFPYFIDDPADGTLYTNAGNSPSQPVKSTWTAISIHESHLLSTIYRPSGGEYVPLKSLEWLWSATSSHGPNGWSTPTGGIGPTGTTYPDFDLDAIQWDHTAVRGQSYPYPH